MLRCLHFSRDFVINVTVQNKFKNIIMQLTINLVGISCKVSLGNICKDPITVSKVFFTYIT